ncbi:hypothetical protein J6590_002912 [Homalodisca vitripennis]|nr:hypothetical protein J6590_100786 [Homalodisca vitripennis]KAG8298945.1 hypothetical protein J6590_002912 [Homalodisca vitripennis]
MVYTCLYDHNPQQASFPRTCCLVGPVKDSSQFPQNLLPRESSEGQQFVMLGHNTQQASFPQNLLLPRGSSEGQQFLMLGHNTQQASFPKTCCLVGPVKDSRSQHTTGQFPQNLLPRGSSEGQQFLMLVTVNSYEPSEQKLRIQNHGHNTQQASFPQNLLLPRGSSKGHHFLMLVTVNSYEPSEQKLGQNVNPPNDDRPQGFPLDRRVNDRIFKQIGNFYFKPVTVYLKEQRELNRIPTV